MILLMDFIAFGMNIKIEKKYIVAACIYHVLHWTRRYFFKYIERNNLTIIAIKHRTGLTFFINTMF